MDFKRIITLFLAIVMCVNLLASAFPTVAYASGGADTGGSVRYVRGESFG